MTFHQSFSENLYDVLGVDSHASDDEIKKMYQTLVLKYHPDKYDEKRTKCTKEEARENFCLITKAWKVLGDAESRIEYDLLLRDEQLNQDWPVDAEVKLSDMEFDEEGEHYSWSCRCGGCYIITKDNITEEEDIICCSTCTLAIRVLWLDDGKSQT